MNRALIILLSLCPFLTDAQQFHNLDFEKKCENFPTGLCFWDLSWGAKNTCKADLDQDNQSLLIDNQSGVGFVEQTALVERSNELQILQLSAKIKTEAVAEGKGAGLNIGVYDSEDNLIFNKHMGGYGHLTALTGSNEWKTYELRAICPPETTKIKIGAILYGPGKAWFDDFEVKIISAASQKPNRLARRYIGAAVDTLAKHSLYKDSIDFKILKESALQIAGSAATTKDCYLAVEYLLQSLGDHHSFFMEPEVVKAWEGEDTENVADVDFSQYRRIDQYGYIKVPPFHGGDPKLIYAFADSLQKALHKLDQPDLSGWIIDLRENTGGNMEPMIAGLGPLFDSETLGYLIDVNGRKEAWKYKNGVYSWDQDEMLRIANPVVLSKRRPIAVLMSPQTGSSGEIVLISFIGNAQTRTFGQASWGLTTGNGAFDLSDGARMMVASTRMADRKSRIFYGRISPDEVVEIQGQHGEDLVLKKAIEWLKK